MGAVAGGVGVEQEEEEADAPAQNEDVHAQDVGDPFEELEHDEDGLGESIPDQVKENIGWDGEGLLKV